MKIDEQNVYAQMAAEKIGATREGLLRNLRNYPNGTYTNTYIYSIIDKEWGKIKSIILKQLDYE